MAADDRLESLVQEWISEEMEEFPVMASTLGMDGYDDRLGSFNEVDFKRRTTSAGKWIDRFQEMDRLTDPQDEVDRDLVVAILRGRLVMGDWEGFRRDPAEYLGPCLSGVFNLFLQRLLPEPELVRCAVARLAEVPSAVGAARRQLSAELMSDVMVQRGVVQCRAGARYFRDLLPAEVADQGARSRLAEAGAEAAGALEELASHLESLQPRGGFAIGEQRYSALLTQREQLGYGADELGRRGAQAWAELDAAMTELAGRMGHGSWRDALEELNRDHPATPEEMLEGYTRATARCRAFLVDTGLVTLPEGESCSVDPSPPFQRPVLAVASYSAPPAFKPSRSGHFFVPYPPEGTGAGELAQRMATNSYPAMPTISAHEAYPGHHWHLVWSQLHAPPVRRILRSTYFVEGWALFAEKVMAEAGFFSDPGEMLCHLEARIFRAARIVVDTALHTGAMDFDAAVAHMTTHTGLTEATARAEVARYCAWPTQAPSYLTGALELERIRDRFLSEGKGDARRFNDAIAATGSLPLGLAERAVMAA